MRQLRDQDVTPRPATRVLAGAAVSADGARASLGAIRAAAFALALASPFVLAWGAWAWMTRTPGFAIRRVIVTGTVFASPESVAAQSGALGRNAFALDLAEVRASVLRDPWIAEASVLRALPQELRIIVKEREPAARETAGAGGPTRVLDASGRVLGESAAGEAVFLGLPELRGISRAPESKRAERRALGAATLHALKGAAPRLHGRAEGLDVGEEGKLVLVAADCPPIWLAGPESADEAAAWSRRENGIMQAIGRAAWVDARWRDRLYVMPVAQAMGAVTSTRTTEVFR